MMDNDLIFRVILAALFIIVLGSRKYFERQAAKTAEQGLEQDKDKRALIVLESLLLTLSNLALIAHVVNPRWMLWSTLDLPVWVRWLGAALGVSGTTLLVGTHRALGKNFFGGMKTRQGHELVMSGPYRWMRHPMYTAFMTIGLSWFLLSGNWMIAVLWLAATILVILTRLKEEERMMHEQFGEDYEEYIELTGRFLPRLRSSPSSIKDSG